LENWPIILRLFGGSLRVNECVENAWVNLKKFLSAVKSAMSLGYADRFFHPVKTLRKSKYYFYLMSLGLF
jgi:hypothetical protein